MPAGIRITDGQRLRNAAHLFVQSVLLLALSPTMCAGKQIVFVHYANDTAPNGKDAENHRVTIKRLESINHNKAAGIAKNLREEPALMAAAILDDRTILREQLCKRLGVPLCEFDNAAARSGQFRIWESAETEPRIGKFSVPETGDYIFDENPLATAAGLRSALRGVAKRFPPQSHHFVLLTQSHGSQELAFTVKLARKHENISVEDFEKLFSGTAVNYGLPTVGVTKSDYFQVLRDAGKEQEMVFAAVILESCKGTIEAPLASELPVNVQLFFASGNRSLDFGSLPWRQIMNATQSPDQLVPAIDQYLAPNFLRIERVQRLPVWLWVLPLVSVLAWQWIQTRRRLRQT